MILSRLYLNPGSRQVQNNLTNLYEFHRTLMSAFPEETTRSASGLLYRIENSRDRVIDGIPVLVQSLMPPSWSALENRDGYLLSSPVNTKKFDFSAGLKGAFRFHLRANPTRRNNQTRKLVGIYKPDQMLAWLIEKGNFHGFQIEKEGILICKQPAYVMHKACEKNDGEKETLRIQIQAADFSGRLKVTDPGAFLQAIRQGIGRGRSFGCGLLSLMRE